jgi:hypothetical protein
MASRELTINGVFYTVEYVPPQAGRTPGLQYTSENGFRCFVPLARTALPATSAAFSSAPEERLAQWGQRAIRGFVSKSLRTGR